MQIELLEQLGSAAALVDEKFCVISANRQVVDLLGTDLVLRNRRFIGRDRASNERLQILISRMLELARTGRGRAACPEILRRDERRPLLVLGLPLSTSGPERPGRCFGVLVFVDPDRRRQPDRQILQRMFGLTGAECKLLLLLAAGRSLAEIAGSLGITKGTARQQLKSSFLKTDTHRQAELVGLLASIAAAQCNQSEYDESSGDYTARFDRLDGRRTEENGRTNYAGSVAA
jgi:DNA-binding CsgD family transcriptional regulator